MRMSIRPSVSHPMDVSSCSSAAPTPSLTSSLPLPEAALNGSWRGENSRSGSRSFAPDWSPDGKVVAAAVIDGSNGSRSIVLLPVDGGSSRELYRTDSGLGRLRWLSDGSGLLTVISEGLERTPIRQRLGRGDLAHRVPKRSSRTPDVRSGQPRSLLPGHRREWQRRRERHQYARVGPLDCAGRSPGRAQAGHLGSPRGFASQLVTRQRHDGVSRLERTLECRPQRRPGVQPAVA